MKRLILISLLFCTPLFGQGWSGIASSRTNPQIANAGHVNTTTGAWAGIPTDPTAPGYDPSAYSVACSHVTPSKDTTGATDYTNIANAIAGCPSGQYVSLDNGDGTDATCTTAFPEHATSYGCFYLSYFPRIYSHNNIVIRGQGPLSTKIIYLNGSGSSSTGCGYASNFCIATPSVSFLLNNVYQAKGSAQANWSGTGGSAGTYNRGATEIDIDKTSGPSAGQILVMNQDNNQIGILNITGDGATATVHTFLPHGFSTNDLVGIGCSLGTTGYAGYNGWQTITKVDNYTFTFPSAVTASCYANSASAAWSSGTTYGSSVSVHCGVSEGCATSYEVGYKSYKSSNTGNAPDSNLTCVGNPCTPYWAVVPAGNAVKDQFGATEPLFMEDTDYVGRLGTGQNINAQNYDATDRSMEQASYITSVGTSKANILTPVYLPGINSGQNPGVRWFTPIHDVGIENLTFDQGNSCNARGYTHPVPARTGGSFCSSATDVLSFLGCFNCWVMNVRFLNTYEHGIDLLGQTSHFEVRNSYWYLGWTENENYSVELYLASDTRIENNIFQHGPGPVVSGPSFNTYFGYNYCNDMFWTEASGQYQGGPTLHDPGTTFLTFEGNTCPVGVEDSYWGSELFTTFFRNWMFGADQLGPNPPAYLSGCSLVTNPRCKSNATATIQMFAYNRYSNVAGNVLGPTTNSGNFTYTTYKTVATQSIIGSTCGSSSAPNSMIVAGFGGVDNAALFTTAGTNYCDPHASDTAFLWGNADIITDHVRYCGNSSNTGWGSWCSSTSEVPSSSGTYGPYANAIPGAESVGNSLIYASQPTWYNSSKGTVVWPPHGPGVTGTTGPTIGGSQYATKIPAQQCLEGTTTTTTVQGAVLNFDGTACYTGSVPPYVLSIVPSGNGSGTVTGGTSISCVITSGVASGTCSEHHSQSDAISLSLSTSDSFTGWSGPCSGTSSPCSFSMPGSDQAVGVQLIVTPTVTLTCSNGCTANINGSVSMTVTTTNIANASGSAWSIIDPIGTTVLSCQYPFDVVTCPSTGETKTLTLLVGGTYTLQAISGGVPATPATVLLTLNSVSGGTVQGQLAH